MLRGARALDIVLRDDENRGGGVRYLLRSLRDGRDLQVHQVFHAHAGDVGAVRTALRAQAGGEEDGRECGHQQALRELRGAIGYAQANQWSESGQTCLHAVARAFGDPTPKAIRSRSCGLLQIVFSHCEFSSAKSGCNPRFPARSKTLE